MNCEMVLQNDVPCTNEASGTTVDGVHVCFECGHTLWKRGQKISLLTPKDTPAVHNIHQTNPEPKSPLQIQNQEPPTDLARSVNHNNKEFASFKDDSNWYLMMFEDGKLRHLTEMESKQAASMLNEQGSNVITLYCRTQTCKEKGAWIKRASADVKKNVYFCEICKHPMVR